LIPVTAGLLAAVILGRPLVTRSQQIPAHQAPSVKNGGVVVMLCDGKTSVELKGAKAGQQLSRAQGMTISRELMAHWQREHPNERWQMAQVTAESAAQTSAESNAQASPAASPGAASGLRVSPHSQGRAAGGYLR
ncbi:MAG TPA: hypothetical protein VGI47_03650, partial [Candidatus Binataceae bacterium]|jgi:type IV secretory pathway TrbL component